MAYHMSDTLLAHVLLDEVDHTQELAEYYCFFVLTHQLQVAHQSFHLGARSKLLLERDAQPILARQARKIILGQEAATLRAVCNSLDRAH